MFSSDSVLKGLVSWDAGTGDYFSAQKDMQLGEWFSHSPTQSLILAGSDSKPDKKARVWLLEDPSAGNDDQDNKDKEDEASVCEAADPVKADGGGGGAPTVPVAPVVEGALAINSATEGTAEVAVLAPHATVSQDDNLEACQNFLLASESVTLSTEPNAKRPKTSQNEE